MTQALSIKQRIGVKLVRAVSATAFSMMGLRKSAAGISVNEFSYGAHKDERLDELQPMGSPQRTDSAVFYMHGGGWIACSKRFYPPDLKFLVAAGWRVFNVEYPLAPEHPHPNLLRSILQAVVWLKQHRPEIKYLHMMGDSAGANLAAMYAVLYSNPDLLAHVTEDVALEQLIEPKTVVSLYGLLDRATILGDGAQKVSSVVTLFLQSYGGPEVLLPGRIKPEHAITPMDYDWVEHPPSLLAVGDVDFLYASSISYADELRARGIPYVLKTYKDAPHGFFNFDHAQRPALRQDILAFLEQHRT
jgi:monoterpene epsilon-lactone hydrolase